MKQKLKIKNLVKLRVFLYKFDSLLFLVVFVKSKLRKVAEGNDVIVIDLIK
jgi:hypothetical protein